MLYNVINIIFTLNNYFCNIGIVANRVRFAMPYAKLFVLRLLTWFYSNIRRKNRGV